MIKPVMLYDARAITCKPCGVRNVAEHYLAEFQSNYDIIAIINPDASGLIPKSVKKVVSSRFLTRFNPISDIWVSLLVLRYRPKVFFSAHSFLPVFALLPEVKAFVCHDLFSVFDKNFFKKKGILAPLARIFFRILTELSFLRASVVVTPSDTIRQTFVQLHAKAKSVCVVNNGITVAKMREISSLRSKQVLFVGNFRNYKGADILLNAWCQFISTAQSSNWSLAVVTNEPDPVIVQLQQSNPKLERVTFHSRISDEELVRLRSTSAIFVVPSRQEGFGMPLIESIAAGGAVICSDIPVFKELLHDFDMTSISMFETENAAKLTQVLAHVAGKIDSSDYETDVTAANIVNLEVIRKQYSWKSAAEKVMSALQ